MFVIYNGTTPLVFIQIEGNQIKIGVPAHMVARDAQPAQPEAARLRADAAAVENPVPSLN